MTRVGILGAVIFIVSCIPFKATKKYTNQEWQQLTNEAIFTLCQPYTPPDSTGPGNRLYIWPVVAWYPSLPPFFDYGVREFDIVSDEKTGLVYQLNIPDDKKGKIELYNSNNQLAFLTDTVTVFLFSPLVSTQNKDEYLIRQYSFWGVDFLRFGAKRDILFVLRNGRLTLKDGPVSPPDLEEKAHELIVIDKNSIGK